MTEKFDYDVFLSFSSQDEKIARSIWEMLTKRGLRVFWSDSTLKLKGGENWYDIISKSLESSRHLILLWSSKSAVSKWVKMEYQSFDSHFFDPPDRLIIPIVVRGNQHSSLPPFLRRMQALSYDSVDTEEESFEKLVLALGGKLSGKKPQSSCYLVASSGSQFSDLRKHIVDVLLELNVEPIFWETVPSQMILDAILSMIKEADFIIADITGNSPNVFMELGYAWALEKPIFLIGQKSTGNLPSNLAGHLFHQYDPQRLGELQEVIRAWVPRIVDKISKKTLGGT